MMTITCPLCNSIDTHTFLHRKKTPVHQNLLMDSYEAAVSIESCELIINICNECYFVFNSAFNVDKLQYGSQYDNRQDCSPKFRSHLDSLINRILTKIGGNNAHIVEVGCGQGDFLNHLLQSNNKLTGTGFDPSYTGPKELFGGRLTFEKRYYDKSCTNTRSDVVISRHVIEHVQYPIDMLKQIRDALSEHSNAKVFFETPCVEWILKNKVIWDLFYEHCSLFSAESLKAAFEMSGFEVLSVSHVFDGQYLWLEAKPSDVSRKELNMKTNLSLLACDYSKAEKKLSGQWFDFVKQLKADGEVAIWGGGAKGTTFLNLIDSEACLIDYVIDINTNKQGRFIAGTGHIIIAPNELLDLNVKNIILMNPNYLNEIKTLLLNNDLHINIHTGF